MPRPERKFVTFSIDGREVSAPEGAMLVDGAKYGDVEIPVFCYEPKLGAPVGACRMCLVEVEGIPKLQTACSTPVKDGMVVHTQTQRVREAQNSVVEFLLVNHPLDCPVCDKGGECPLQDITFGWGRGISRMVEPKRHFKKPLELSPLIAIDRERCILCYRCVRFSQEVSEDYQLVLNERGASSFVGTFDGHPYVAPFSGNIIELCPVGALTSRAYRFRARPWDIEGSGSVCNMCPAQCNVEFTVRDERVLRVLARDNEGVDDGWLCDKGRFAYQAIHAEERLTQPLVRGASGQLEPASWDVALDAAAAALSAAKGGRAAAIVGGQTTNEEGFLLQRLLREGVGSPHVDARVAGSVPVELQRALAAPGLQATIPDIEFAHTVLVLGTEPVDDAATLDLRIRKGVRRNGVKLAVATARPSALDPNSRLWLRYAPGTEHAFLAALDAALSGAGDLDALCAKADADPKAVQALAAMLKDGGEDVVIVWGERIGAAALPALLNVAQRLGLDGRPGAGLIEVPAGSNQRGLRDVGVQPNAGPGLADPKATGKDARAIAEAAADGQLTTLYLLHADPVRDRADKRLWQRALEGATNVVAHASLLSPELVAHATVVFPAESYAEKEGTTVNLDGRVQRLRTAIGRPGAVRAEWQVIADVAARIGLDLRVLTGPMATQQLIAAVPYFAGLTLEEIGGRGVRWPEREAVAGAPEAPAGPFEVGEPAAPLTPNGALRLGTYKPIWAAPEVEASPALKFLAARQHAELSPLDADRIGVDNGDKVTVGTWTPTGQPGSSTDADGRPLVASVTAKVVVRANVPAGTVFLAEATREQSVTELTGVEPKLVTVEKWAPPVAVAAAPDDAGDDTENAGEGV